MKTKEHDTRLPYASGSFDKESELLAQVHDDKANQERLYLTIRDSQDNYMDRFDLFDGENRIASDLSMAHAKLIVLAVNNAEKLTEALKEIERKTRISDPDVVSLHDIASYALADWQKGQS